MQNTGKPKNECSVNAETFRHRCQKSVRLTLRPTPLLLGVSMNIPGSNRRRALACAIAVGAIALQLSMGAAMAVDPVQARKDLKAMGVEYTEQDFAKVAGNGDVTAIQLFVDSGMDVNSGGG